MPAPTTIGAFEAKTHFSALLDRVEHGESLTITKHGREVARLVPSVPDGRERAAAAVAKWRETRKQFTLGPKDDWKTLRDEGRKW